MRDLKISELVELCNHTNCEDCEFFNANLDYCIFSGSIPIGWEEIANRKKPQYKELSETIDLMTSEDYKDRFKAEYYQLKIRYEKLDNMVKNWDNLSFEPTCSKETFNTQLEIMLDYLKILEVRAMIEDIELN